MEVARFSYWTDLDLGFQFEQLTLHLRKQVYRIVYKGEAQLYARKLLPQEVTRCTTERKATGVYSKLLTCK
jgi:hypothetical protein